MMDGHISSLVNLKLLFRWSKILLAAKSEKFMEIFIQLSFRLKPGIYALSAPVVLPVGCHTDGCLWVVNILMEDRESLAGVGLIVSHWYCCIAEGSV